MTVQVAVKLPDALAHELDRLVRSGDFEGLPVESVASFDNLRPFPKAMLVRRLGGLGPRMHEICGTADATLDC